MPKEAMPVPAIFSRADFFAGLTEEDLAHIVTRFKKRAFDRDSFLFLEGEQAKTFYLIAEGQVKILQTSAEGFDVIMHILGSGELIGALPTIETGTYPASAQALSEVIAFSIPASDFNEILHAYPAATLNLLRFSARVLQTSLQKIREMSTERVERRIARTLARLANQMGCETKEGILVDAPLTRQDLAEMTGTTIFTVSRTLKEWERDGILHVGRQRVIITDPHRLVSIGEDLP
jgi:CRP-like cAMP-binding protein